MLQFSVSLSVMSYANSCCTELRVSVEVKCTFVVVLHQPSYVKEEVRKELPILLILKAFLTS